MINQSFFVSSLHVKTEQVVLRIFVVAELVKDSM